MLIIVIAVKTGLTPTGFRRFDTGPILGYGGRNISWAALEFAYCRHPDPGLYGETSWGNVVVPLMWANATFALDRPDTFLPGAPAPSRLKDGFS